MIQSYLIQNVTDGKQFLFYDTVSEGKHVFAACGLGKVKKKDAHLSEIAKETLFALGDYVENSVGKVATIRFQEIAAIPIVPVRIRKALAAADDKDIVFFVCRSPDIYDAAVSALNVQWKIHATPQ